MSADDFQDLPWLKPQPDNFPDLCRQVGKVSGECVKQLRWLSGHALDDNGLYRLAKTFEKVKRSEPLEAASGFQPYRLGLLSNSTTKLIVPSLVGTALRYQIDLQVFEGGFNQVVQDALSPESAIAVGKPDGVLVALDYHGIPGLDAGFRDDEEDAVQEALDYLMLVCSNLKAHTSATIIVQNIACPPSALFGSLDAALAGSQRRRIEYFNNHLLGILEKFSGILFDVDGIARAVGYRNWFAPRLWHMAKIPFAQGYCPLYAEGLLRLIGALRGCSKKCLVMDLDNTLWGGVIGDDDLNGIKLGQGDPVGEAFLAIQQLAKQLKDRGVVLAVCSKNNDEVARRVFREHPDMVLREEDISVFQANWSDKAANLVAIANTLNISTGSLVFLDDNPAERELIRQALPEAAVPELSDDPSTYPSVLLSAGYFESVGFTHDDRKRAEQYRANSMRARLSGDSHDPTVFLTSLNMEAIMAPFDETGRARIAQLVNRSNQFNLTTRRYDEAAIAAFERDTAVFTLQVRLVDRFGDNGMISVIICKTVEEFWVVDTWLMSCRVLSRRVEEAVLDVLVDNARSRGIRKIIGHYIPTERNGMVRDHYARLGFQLADGQPELDVWEMDVPGYRAKNPPIRITLQGRLTPPLA